MLVAALVVGELSRPFSYLITANEFDYLTGPVLARKYYGIRVCYAPLFLVPGSENCATVCSGFSIG